MKIKIKPLTLAYVYGLIGIVGFSLTFPATREAVTYFNPLMVGLGRVFLAGLASLSVLWMTRQRLPSREHWWSLMVVAGGVAIGFSLLTSWAMLKVPASHGGIMAGLMPLATALIAGTRAGEKMSLRFWMASFLGCTTVIFFSSLQGVGEASIADLVLVGAMLFAATGYVEGGRLARTIGGWQTISWALVMALPFVTFPLIFILWKEYPSGPPAAWLALGYISLFSQYFVFFPWYQALALGGIARIGQVQLLQPFLTLLAAWFFLGEKITPLALGAALVVISMVAIGRKG